LYKSQALEHYKNNFKEYIIGIGSNTYDVKKELKKFLNDIKKIGEMDAIILDKKIIVFSFLEFWKCFQTKVYQIFKCSYKI
jgi:hypothetical protein